MGLTWSDDDDVRQLDARLARMMTDLVRGVREYVTKGSPIVGLLDEIEDAADRRDLMNGDAEELAGMLRQLGAEVEAVAGLLTRIPAAMYAAADALDDGGVG